MNLARYNPERIATASLLDPVFVFAKISIKMILASIPASIPIVPKLIESGMRNYKLKTPAPDLFRKEDLKKYQSSSACING